METRGRQFPLVYGHRVPVCHSGTRVGCGGVGDAEVPAPIAASFASWPPSWLVLQPTAIKRHCASVNFVTWMEELSIDDGLVLFGR